MELIDSHAHIDFPQFADDRDAMLERARAAGVTTLLAIGTGPGQEKLDAALPFAERHDWIYTTVGIHPHEAKEVTPHHLELPIIIHCRDAWSDCLNLIEENWRSSGLGGILHCFSSTLEDARRGIDMGFLISFAGNATYPKAQNLRDIAKALPLENLLIETDAPYLAPQPYRGKRNEPAYVVEVARTLASVRNLPPEEVAAATAANFRRFFLLAIPSAPGTDGTGELTASGSKEI